MSEFEKLQLAGLQPSILVNRLNLSGKTLGLLFAKVHVLENGCWEWVGAKAHGYGKVHIRSLVPAYQPSHRLFYQLANGPLGTAVQMHHKVKDGCIGPACCNPSHLQETTAGEHTRDLTPASVSYIASHRDHCAAGHTYTIESTRVGKGGTRACRICDKIKAQAKRDRLRGDKPKFHRDLHERCIRGHELSGDNLYYYQTKDGRQQRRCRTCQDLREEEYRSRGGTVQPKKEFCINGHPLKGDNLFFRSNGFAGCRKCAVTVTQRWQANHREEYLESRRASRKEDRSKAAAFKAEIVGLAERGMNEDAMVDEFIRLADVYGLKNSAILGLNG